MSTTNVIDIDPRDRLRHRHEELKQVLEGVTAELDLCVFLAHRRGVSDAEIAEIVREDPATVREIIDSHRNDEEADRYEEGPRWMAMWPNHNL
ncbi:MAG: hypothetical protein WCA46_18475 [Actinocatenispora sp.]